MPTNFLPPHQANARAHLALSSLEAAQRDMRVRVADSRQLLDENVELLRLLRAIEGRSFPSPTWP
jgi:hypothetical protein